MKVQNEYDNKKILIKGYVRYKDLSPVKGAVVILEKFSRDCREETTYLTYTLTNKWGEFGFIITDRTSSYLIKVFDNHHR